MTEANGFKHISVTSEGEDDVVIHAGVVKPSTEVVEPANPLEASEFEKDSKELAAQAPKTQEQGAKVHADAPQEHGGAPKTPEAQKAPKRDEYRQTTLEDLTPAPMPSMQKGIIAFAVLAMVAAVVYYLVFLR